MTKLEFISRSFALYERSLKVEEKISIVYDSVNFLEKQVKILKERIADDNYSLMEKIEYQKQLELCEPRMEMEWKLIEDVEKELVEIWEERLLLLDAQKELL
jgi:hypothetical protein